MTKFVVLVTAPELAPDAARKLREAGCQLHFTPAFPSAPELAAMAGRLQPHAILCRQGRVDGGVLDASSRLRIVARHGVGTDEVDLQAATSRGIWVTRTPGTNTAATAEHTIALLLALLKNLRPLSAAVAQGGWRAAGTETRDAAGLRLGLVGLGAVGQAVAHIARALGIHISAWSPSGRPEVAGVTRMPDIPSLLAASDVLSLHCPLTAANHHLINVTTLAMLPRGALLINTARGGLVDEAALLEALNSGHLVGAGLDVFEAEPPATELMLRRHRQVIATPHVSGSTRQALDRSGMMAAEAILAVLVGSDGMELPPGQVVLAGRV